MRRLINAQQANLYASVYYDPFNPDVFHLPPGVGPYGSRYDPFLSLDTLSAFSPTGLPISNASSPLNFPFWIVQTFLHQWIVPFLPKLRLSPSTATDRIAAAAAVVVPI